jgi:hypothetical protein
LFENPNIADLFEVGIRLTSEKLGIPSDSIILCVNEHSDDVAAPRLSRAQWEKVPEQVKWQMIWIAHATLEKEGIWS